MLELRWESGAHVELLVGQDVLAGCEVEASLVGQDVRALALVGRANDRVIRFSLPAFSSPSGQPITAALAVRWHCPNERAVEWQRFSLRW
jgi:hypothetical protein